MALFLSDSRNQSEYLRPISLRQQKFEECLLNNKFQECFKNVIIKITRLGSSVTRLGDLLDFGLLFKAFGNN